MQVLLAYPVLQVPRAAWPFTQAGAALAKGVAAALHAPQLAASVSRFASQPLLGSPSHSPNLRGRKKDLQCNVAHRNTASNTAPATHAADCQHVSITCSPFLADAQGRLATHASWYCIGKGRCCFLACPAIGGVCVEVCLTPIAWISITITKSARLVAVMCNACVAAQPILNVSGTRCCGVCNNKATNNNSQTALRLPTLVCRCPRLVDHSCKLLPHWGRELLLCCMLRSWEGRW
jgi:hypothetical protein